VHREPDAAATAWTAGLLGLAGDRPVVVVDTLQPDPTSVPDDAIAVVTVALDRVALDRRSSLVEVVATAAVVLLCAPPDGDGGVRDHPPETLPEWLALLGARGLYRVPDADLGWLPSWGVVVERVRLEVPELVRRYERQLLPAVGHRPPSPLDGERLLALTDRIIGLEATLAEANYRRDMALLDRQAAILAEQAAGSALEAATRMVDAMRASASWRLGQRLVVPLRRASAAVPGPLRRQLARRRSR
jgi:hypothetical protein